MAIYHYLACRRCKTTVPLSRSGRVGNGPLAGDEARFAFLDAHEKCGWILPLVVISDTDPNSGEYSSFTKEKAPDLSDRG